ncbi:MAG: acylphosphatase [Actinomycetota bacterium]
MADKYLHIIVKGYVHGVGFRFYAIRYADKLNINGTVRNKYDGSVEIYAEGKEEDINKFIEVIKTGPRSTVIREVIIDEYKKSRDYNTFDIIF